MSRSIQTTNLNKSRVDNKAFWKERLEDLQPLTVPYLKQALSANQQYVNQVKSIPDELLCSLQKSFPNSELADTILIAFVSYMARINTTACFDIGFANSKFELEVNLEGLFALYIPCRIEIDFEQDFTETFNVIREQIEFASANQSDIVEIIATDPILNTLSESEDNKIFPIAFKRVPSLEDSHTSQILGRDLTVIISDCGDCCLLYDSNNWCSESVARMWEQFQTFLSSIAKNPDKYLIYQSILPESERQKIWEWNHQNKTTQDKCIQQLFEEQVQRTPDAVASTYRDEQLTYRELNERANQLAHYLRSLGVAPEVLVGFCLNRSLDTIVGMLGVLKAGGAYVPLDPAYPLERLKYMADDSKISILLTQNQLKSQLPHQAKVLIDSDWSQIALHSKENPTMNNTGDNLAYVIYTSGSTGKPKGVMITHSALSNFAQTAIAEYKIQNSDRVLQFASINFDIAVEEIYTCLLSGSTLVLRTDEMLADMKTFCQTCQNWQITILNLPTAYWHQLMAEWESVEAYFPESVRLVIIGGEKVLSEPVKRWQEYVKRSGKSDRLQLINSYGPTETTVSATLYRIPTDADTITSEVPIGRPFGHLQTYILDPYGQPVPIGVPGELHIGGSSLARGYLNRPELTKEKFIPNPTPLDKGLNPPAFSRGDRLYKTGDLVRYLPALKDTALHNGNIEYIGRIDKQVKIRGFRIELGEIETVIAQYPDIQQTAVIAREDIPGDKRLVAYIVPQRQDLPKSQIRSFLQKRLPHYMVPSAYVKLDSLPITPGGKVDRRALPAPEFHRSEFGKTVAPRNDLELKIATIWEEILNTSPIGVQDNFFDLGGHSLLAVSLLTRIEKTFKKNIPLTTFLSVPTIEGIANVISQETTSESESLIFNIRTTGSKPPLFLINAMGTGMLAYKLLTQYLDPEIPVYGIRAIGMDDRQDPQNRIEQMAQTYIKEMLTVQPEGPYCVAGVCTGGTVAFEMASQLRSRGLEVAFLGLIDSTARPILSDDLDCTSTKETKKPLLSKFFDRYIKHNFILRGANNLWAVVSDPGVKLKEKLSFTFDMVEQLYQKVGHKLEIIYKNNKQLPYEVRRSRVFDAGMEALSHYTPRTYKGGKVLLIRAKDNPEHIYHNYELGWDEFITDELEVAEIPADQTTLLFEPHIRTLAAKLNSCLDQCDCRSE